MSPRRNQTAKGRDTRGGRPTRAPSGAAKRTSAQQTRGRGDTEEGSATARSSRPAAAVSSAPRTKSVAPGERKGVTVTRPMGSRMKVKGMGLRAKLMLTISLLTGVGMLVLGIAMAVTTNSFLVNQSKHHGIELAKMAAQVGRAVADMQALAERSQDQGEITFSGKDLEKRIEFYFENARSWGDTQRFTFIDAVQFIGGRPGMAGYGVGNLQKQGSSAGQPDSDLTVPGRGQVPLGTYDDIEVFSLDKDLGAGRTLPVYRFRVKLNQPFPESGYVGDRPMVQVDVARDSLATVSRWLYLILIGSVIVVVGICLVVANLQARKITEPVRWLMRDMQVVAQGNLDHRTKAHSKDEVGVLAHEFDLMTQNLKVAQEAMVEQEKAEYELSIAREVQQQLLPASTPDLAGYELASFYQGAKAVSGDYYDFIPLSDDMMGFIVADVSGKGVPGSMVMAVTRTIVRLVANKHQQNAADTLKETNRLIAKQIKRGMFVTAFYAVLDRRSGVLTFASAGHNPMVVYRHQQRKIELAAPKGIAIGFNEGPLFDKNVQQFQIQLGVGDLVAIYTDGFPEAMNEDNEEFGDEQFYRRIGAYGPHGSQGVIDGLLRDVTAHRGEAPQSDDLTILCLRRNQ